MKNDRLLIRQVIKRYAKACAFPSLGVWLIAGTKILSKGQEHAALVVIAVLPLLYLLTLIALSPIAYVMVRRARRKLQEDGIEGGGIMDRRK